MISEELRNRWLPFRAQARAGGLPLFCVPHAGGGASAFRPWLGKMPGVAVQGVQSPGREARFREEPITRMEPLVAELARVVTAEAGGPYAIYGHSLGALTAFELVRELRRSGAAGPVQLFVSGSVAPQHAANDGPSVLKMSRAEVVNMLRALGGTAEWLLADPSVVDMILPAVRADFSVKETYTYRAESPLSVPITVLASTDDPRAGQEPQSGWREHTTAEFDMHTLVGGHFAVLEQDSLTHKYLTNALRPWL